MNQINAVSPNWIMPELQTPQIPSEKESWETVLEADKARGFLAIGTAIEIFLKSHPQETYATVEVKLRKNRCFTYLTAIKIDDTVPEHRAGMKAVNLKGKVCDYYLWLDVRSKELALAHRRVHAANDQLNLLNLNNPGNFVFKPTEFFTKLAETGLEAEMTKESLNILMEEINKESLK